MVKSPRDANLSSPAAAALAAVLVDAAPEAAGVDAPEPPQAARAPAAAIAPDTFRKLRRETFFIIFFLLVSGVPFCLIRQQSFWRPLYTAFSLHANRNRKFTSAQEPNFTNFVKILCAQLTILSVSRENCYNSMTQFRSFSSDISIFVRYDKFRSFSYTCIQAIVYFILIR